MVSLLLQLYRCNSLLLIIFGLQLKGLKVLVGAKQFNAASDSLLSQFAYGCVSSSKGIRFFGTQLRLLNHNEIPSHTISIEFE